MASFNDLTDTKQLRHRHSGMITVFVEGQTDVDYLTRMFPNTPGELKFEPVGGCTRMRARLDLERPGNPSVIGVIDRDALLRETRWDHLFETDNDNFQSVTFQDGLYVLTRWEIENYLFEVVAVKELIDNLGRPASRRTEDALLDMMIDAAVGELYVTAGMCTAHKYGVDPADRFPECAEPAKLKGIVDGWVAEHLRPEAQADYEEHVAKVQAFDPGPEFSKRERLYELLRMVDGKRFVKRLERVWLSRFGRDPALQLAANVGKITARRDDLAKLVNGLLTPGTLPVAS